MAGFLASVGTLTYNGVTFPNHIQCQVHVRTVRDTANRHIKYTEWTLNVETIFHDPTGLAATPPDLPAVPTNLDTDIPTIRRKLSQSGAPLEFTGKGLGNDLTVKTATMDVAYGPFPEVIAWEFLGGNKAVRCVWTVTFRIPEIENENRLITRLTELNYTISWSISESGLTRRTIVGIMELAVSRALLTSPVTKYSVPDTVDRFRENFRAEVPLGFSRVQQDWSLSADKRFLHFTIVDEEIPGDNPYYPGVIRPRVRHSVNSNPGGLSFARWLNVLSGTIEVAPGFPRWFAWAAFLLVLRKRLDAAVNAQPSTNPDCPNRQAGVKLITSISIAEEVFGRSTDFAVSWLLTTNLSTLFAATGLWTVNDDVTWTGYRQSMTVLTNNWNHRGNAGMVHSTTDDAIVAMAYDAPQTINVNSGVTRGRLDGNYQYFDQPCPEPSNSWLVFHNDVALESDTAYVSHRPLETPEQLSQNPTTPNDPNAINQSGPTNPPVTYRRTATTYRVRMRGYAMRVCYPVPEMHLTQYGGVPVVPDSSLRAPVQSRTTLTTLMHPVYMSQWDKTYLCQGTPVIYEHGTQLNPRCYQD